MTAATAALLGLACGLGIALALYGWRVAPIPRPARAATRRRGVPRKIRVRALAGLGLGALIWVVAGWWIAMLALPAAAVGIPLLLAAPSRTGLTRLEALEEWTRGLAGVLTVGVGIEQAILATARSAPAAIGQEVGALAARLSARTPTDVALRRFADDLDDATGDLVVMSLLLGASRRGSGLSAVLSGLAESVADEARIRRSVEADRAKLRTAARWITGITLFVLGGLFWNGEYVAPYHTALGQVLLLIQLAAYGAALVWIRVLAAGRPPARLLVAGGAA